MNLPPTPNSLRPTILITGAKGQLGYKISQLLAPNYRLILTDIDNMDITNISQVRKFIKTEKPDYIIHGAAYTKVDLAEDEKELCYKINALGTKNIAEIAKENGITLIYVSTDYVFNGEKNSPYSETDRPNPLSVYGQTKLEGEEFVKEICEKYYILRVSWLFGELPENTPGTNFIETMLRLGKERDKLNIVGDQTGSPTYTKDLVEVIDKIVGRGEQGVGGKDPLHPTPHTLLTIPYGLYHFSGTGECSWYDFATEIFKLTKNKIEIISITSDQYPQKAKRPTYSYLSKGKIESTLKITVRPWQEMVKEYLDARNSAI